MTLLLSIGDAVNGPLKQAILLINTDIGLSSPAVQHCGNAQNSCFMSSRTRKSGSIELV